jgi:cytochrome P450
MDMAIYGMQHAARWRTLESAGAISDDLTSYILQTEFGGKLMTDLDFGVFFVQLVTAGQDTTQTMLASGLHTLLLPPEQLAQLRTTSAGRPLPTPC